MVLLEILKNFPHRPVSNFQAETLISVQSIFNSPTYIDALDVDLFVSIRNEYLIDLFVDILRSTKKILGAPPKPSTTNLQLFDW